MFVLIVVQFCQINQRMEARTEEEVMRVAVTPMSMGLASGEVAGASEVK